MGGLHDPKEFLIVNGNIVGCRYLLSDNEAESGSKNQLVKQLTRGVTDNIVSERPS